MLIRRLSLIVSVSLALILPSTAIASEVETVVDQIVQAYGGAEAVSALTAYRVEGRVEALIRGLSGKTVRRFRAPDHFRVELDYGEHSELRILAGDQGWRGQTGQLVPARGPLLDSMLSHLLRSDLPGTLIRFRDRLEDRGTVELNGRSFRLLVLPFSGSLTLSYWIDPESWLVIRAEGQLMSPAMQMAFETRYSDFRAVEGVLFAHHEENWAGPSHVASTHIEKVVVEPQKDNFFNVFSE